MANYAIEAEGIRKAFDDQEVLRGVDLRVEEGSITMLVGRSGSGKTVLLKSLAGLIQPDSGTVKFFGAEQRLGRRRDPAMLSYLFQHNALLDSLTAEENVALPLAETTRMSTSEIAGRVGELFEKLDLSDMGKKFPGDLSGGMQRRVALARSLILEPKIVLFDEPTTGLDPIRRNAVLEMIVDYRKRFGFTAVVVTHDLPGSLLIAQHLALLELGELVYNGPVSGVKADDGSGTMNRFLHHEEGLADRVLEADEPEELKEEFTNLASKYSRMFSVGVTEDAGSDIDPLGVHLSFPVAAAGALAQLRRSGVAVSGLFRTGCGELIGFADADPGLWEELTASVMPVTPNPGMCYWRRSIEMVEGDDLEASLEKVRGAQIHRWESPR